jgi:hypothetical protein
MVKKLYAGRYRNGTHAKSIANVLARAEGGTPIVTSTVLEALAVLTVSIEMPVTAAVFAFYLVGHGA